VNQLNFSMRILRPSIVRKIVKFPFAREDFKPLDLKIFP